MQYRNLGATDLEVSLICLGTMTWGEQNTEAEAREQIEIALEAGVNFIDTAELYPVPPKADTQGLTESYLGNWLHKNPARRERLVIATKAAAAADWISYLRNGEARLDEANLRTALETSLQRLRTDYVDLYQVHWPERATNFFGRLGYREHRPEKDGVPIAETLEALAKLVQEGKVRHIGISNETPWGVTEYLRLARQHDWPRIVSVQNPYNLLNRSFEVGLAEIACREKVGLLAYSPLAFGALSGKYLNGARPPGARLTLFTHFTRYLNDRATAATRDYVQLAQRHDLDPAQMALAFVNAQPFLTSNIIGATRVEQLRSDLASAELALSTEVLEEIGKVHDANPNPAP